MDKSLRTVKGSEPWIIEELKVILATKGSFECAAFETVLAADVPVTLEYDYRAGVPARNMHLAMEDAEEEIPAELTITAAKATTYVFLDGDSDERLSLPPGYDVWKLVGRLDAQAIEDELFKKVSAA